MIEKTEQNRNLKHAIVLISSLISLSRSVKVFTSRWRSIRTKLDGLYSDLSAIDKCVSGENLLPLSIVVDSIISTLTTCEDDVARPCLDSTFTGKLRTQSDLDAVASKLDAHSKSLSDIYAVGLRGLAHGPSVSRDDVGDLLCRLRIGCADAKKRALTELNDVVRGDERSAKIAVEIDGFANSLVILLDSPAIGIPEETCRSVSAIAGFQTCRGALINAGIIAPLIRVLESGTELGKENAARCLRKFTENSDHVWSVSAHGGVPPLLRIIRGAATESIVLACGVLKNFSGVEEIKRFMVEKGAVFDLIELVKSKHEAKQICSIDLLLAMADRDNPVKEIIIRDGGIRAMVRVLDPKMLTSTKAREVALRGITSICDSSENSIGMLISYSFIYHILYFLRDGEMELGLKASFWLCGVSEEAKKVMGDEGFMEVLVRFLDSKSYEVREMASEILTSLLEVSKNRKIFAQSEEGVGVLIRMLEAGEVNGSNKKLARKMSSNRFQSMLSGTLWHS